MRYQAPEVRGSWYDKPSDVYSYAVVGSELRPSARWLQALLRQCSQTHVADRPCFAAICDKFEEEGRNFFSETLEISETT